MPDTIQTAPEQEPIGIIISRGRTTLPSPRFSAYVWGMVDEPETPPSDTKVP